MPVLARFEIDGWLQQVTNLRLELLSVRPEIILAILALPVLLALISRRPSVIIAVLLLMVAVYLLLPEPAPLATILAIGGYVTGLIVPIAALGNRRRAGRVESELGELRREVQKLQSTYERRLLSELKSSSGQDQTK